MSQINDINETETIDYARVVYSPNCRSFFLIVKQFQKVFPKAHFSTGPVMSFACAAGVTAEAGSRISNSVPSFSALATRIGVTPSIGGFSLQFETRIDA